MAKSIILKPIVTEKMTRLMEEGRHYAFKVAKDANKIQIRQAIEARYPGVEIKDVRTMIVRGKRKRQMTRRGVMQGRQASYKKAIVTLRSGEIDFFESV
ncbi:MAG: 50S ribosomal protein L23 [Rhodothermaceae bacterium]|nr:50S ribosomal protein L23 [Rhodothermaceae bacterium]